VAAAGARYDGNPYLEMVDVSSVGYWGEGWSNYMPVFQYQKALIDIYLDAFKRTPLLMNFDQAEALAYGVSHGTGWRLDCWGDMGMLGGEKKSGRSLMLDRYPEQVVETNIQNAWMRSPVSLETSWVPGYRREKKWHRGYIMEQALRWHVSSVNIKSSAIPPDWKQKFREFEKKMGYRFVLRRFEYPGSVRAGDMMPVESWWVNKGVAPVYANYKLAFAFGDAVMPAAVNLRKWLPGHAVFDGSLYVPETLKPGKYRMRVAMLDPRTGLPAIKLAISGRQPDGWYDVGDIEVR